MNFAGTLVQSIIVLTRYYVAISYEKQMVLALSPKGELIHLSATLVISSTVWEFCGSDNEHVEEKEQQFDTASALRNADDDSVLQR